MSTSDFEAFMLPRLNETTNDEATRVVCELWDGRRLEDAVLDAIESLPAKKTRRLRAWVEQARDFSEWRALEREGWEMEKFWRGAFARPEDRLAIFLPRGDKTAEAADHLDAIAAGAGAGEVSFVGTNKRVRPGSVAYVFRVTRSTI